jgi:uncharacterized protein HemX
MEQINFTQLMGVVIGSNALLIGALVYIAKTLGPSLLDWMKRKIDEKNGHIGELVEETKRLASDISRLTQALMQQIEQGNCTQAQTLCAMQETCTQHSQQITRLLRRIEQVMDNNAA